MPQFTSIDRNLVVSSSPRDAFLLVGDKKVFSVPASVTDIKCDNSGVLGDRPVPIAEADEHMNAPYGSDDDTV